MPCRISDNHFANTHFYDHFWASNDETLAFCIELPKGLKFAEQYGTWKTKNGIGCDILCYPTEEVTFLSPSKRSMDHMLISIQLDNSGNHCEINFIHESQRVYKDKSELETKTIKTKGTLTCAPLNTDIIPKFFVVSEDESKGVFEFTKNSRS